MKILLIWAFSLSFYSLFKIGNCENQDEIVSITTATEEQVIALQEIINATINKPILLMPASPKSIRSRSEVHLFVPADSADAINDFVQRNNLEHRVLMHHPREEVELQKNEDSFFRRRGGKLHTSFYEQYHSLEEIYDWINTTAQHHPKMVETFSIGTSVENRPLYVLKLSGKKRVAKKAIWMDCGIHAREWISPAFCLWFVDHIVTTYKKSKETKRILDNLDIYVLPVLNPDGYKYTWTSDQNMRYRMWRKNRFRSNDSDCVGVDLNRNFDAKWCTEGSTDDICDEIYCGSAPESEPEAKAVADFIRSHNDSLLIYFSMHSYSQMLLFPYSYSYDNAPNHDELLELVKEVSEIISNTSGNNYVYGPGAPTIYAASGGSDDFAYDQGIKYAFTFELQDRGKYGFLLPPSRIERACKEALIGVTTITLRVIEKTAPDT